MQKRKVKKEDGRYLIFYGFDRPIPQLQSGEFIDEADETGETSSGLKSQEEDAGEGQSDV